MIHATSLAEFRTRVSNGAIDAAATETGVPPEIQWEHLEALEGAGMLVLLVVDDGAAIVGWCCAALAPECFRAQRSCTTLSLWVRPDLRGRWGLRLVRSAWRTATERGALFRLAVLPGSRLERLAVRLGLMRTAVVFEA